MKNKPLSKRKLHELAKVFNNDLDLVLFFLKWIEKGQNSQQAYKELHPDVDIASAGVLGSRMLKKVRVETVLETYGLGLENYLEQLKDGLKATKWNDFTGEREPDHKTREHYHDKQGRLLGIEQNPTIAQQFNVGGEMTLEFIKDDKG